MVSKISRGTLMTPNFKWLMTTAVTLLGLAHLAPYSFSVEAVAQETEIKANAVGVGSGWQGSITSVDGTTFDDEQLAVVAKIDEYFNDIQHLRGRFAQTDAQKRVLKGKFYVQWPGRFRFDYARPSRMVIFSDGRYLRIEDLELKNTETYELNSTPFRIILARKVDILRDARVIRVAQSDTEVSISLRDKKEDTGVIQLHFNKTADNKLSLAYWVITDAQGLDTQIVVSQLETGKRANPKLFEPSGIGLPGLESKN